MTDSTGRLARTASLLALAGALALGACTPAPETTDNAQVDPANALAYEETGLDNEAPVIEDVADDGTPAVAVAAVPKPAAGAPRAEAAPLEEASAIEEGIRAGTGISRIRYGEGWAWMRDGRILRTADRDGRNVAYFRRGEERPFFVQRGDRSWSYDNGRPAREFDREGRGRAPDADRNREAEEAAHDAGERRQGAERARNRAEGAGWNGRDRPRASPTPAASPRPAPSASPTPSPSPTATRGRGEREGGRGEREGGPGWRDRPRPDGTPTSRPQRNPGS